MRTGTKLWIGLLLASGLAVLGPSCARCSPASTPLAGHDEPAAEGPPHPPSFEAAATEAQLVERFGCLAAVPLPRGDEVFRALVFDAGQGGYKVAIYRREGLVDAVKSTTFLDGFERPFVRGEPHAPELAAQHRTLRLVWSFRYEGGDFRLEPDQETVENGRRYRLGETSVIDRADFARQHLGDEELAREIEEERASGSDGGPAGR